MKAAGAEVRAVGNQAHYTGDAFHFLGGRGFWLNQIFFTIRRLVYGLTLALGGLGAAAILVGFQFNAMMEQQSLAFRIFTGSAAAAKREVQFLYNLAAHGPFEFTQVISGARQLQAFGFTVGETNKLLVSLQDAMAGMGLDQASLDRATLALGQIRSTGRLLGQDLRQLEQLGLVSPEDLARRLNIPQASLANIGQLNIPSKTAIDAIEAYWRERFHGAARDFQHTWTGEMSTLKDYGRALFGQMVEPLQLRLERHTLPTVMKIAQEANKGFKAKGMEGFFEAIDKGVGHGVDFVTIWQRVSAIGITLGKIWLITGAAWLTAFHILGIGTKAAWLLYWPLHGILWILQHTQPVLGPLIALWLAEKTALLLLASAKKLNLLLDVLGTRWTLLRGRAESIYLVWLLRRYYATRIITGIETAWIAVQLAAIATTEALTGAVETLTLAIMANPIGLIIGLFVLLVAGLVILYFKWNWFHNLINSIATWIWGHAYILALIPVLGPFLFVVAEMIKNFGALKRWLIDLVGWVQRLVHWIGRVHAPHIGGRGHWWNQSGLDLIGLQHGGEVTRAGAFMVGEHGPEMAILPAGAAVHPLPPINVASHGGTRLPRELVLKIPVKVDGRQIAEANARYNLDVLARR